MNPPGPKGAPPPPPPRGRVLAAGDGPLHLLFRPAPPSRQQLHPSLLRISRYLLLLLFGSGPSHTPPPPSSIFGDDAEVANVPPLTTPKLFVSGNVCPPSISRLARLNPLSFAP